MDKSIFTALNSMQILKNNQSVTSQNLSNTNVPGFKKDIHANFGSLYLDREKGIDPRVYACLLYTSPSPRDLYRSRMPSSA